MLSENFLNDDFKMTGNSLDEFNEVLTEVVKHTKAEKICTADLTVLSYSKERSNEDIDKLTFYRLPSGNPWKGFEGSDLAIGYVNRGKIMANGNFSSLINEMCTNTKTMLLNGKKPYFVSRFAFDSLGRRAKFAGQRLLENDLARNINLAQGLGVSSTKDNGTMIYREINGISKIFSIFTEKYSYVPQTVLVDVLNVLKTSPMGKMVCNDWEINHEITMIHVEFPEKADELQKMYNLPDRYIPGLYLATSDTGNSSLTACTTWRIGRSISHGLGISEDNSEGVMGKRKHIGDIDANQFCEKADKEIFSKYSKLPEILCELLTIDITDPVWNLNDKKDARKNKEAVAASIKNVFKKIQMVKNIGKGLEKQLYEALCDEIDPTLIYTAYDVVTMIMSLAERCDGLAKSTANNLRAVISKAPYCDFSKNPKQKLTLTA